MAILCRDSSQSVEPDVPLIRCAFTAGASGGAFDEIISTSYCAIPAFLAARPGDQGNQAVAESVDLDALLGRCIGPP